MRSHKSGRRYFGWFALILACPLAYATEHITLRNGFELDCVRREVTGDRMRLFFAGTTAGASSEANFLEVAAESVVRIEQIADLPQTQTIKLPASPVSLATHSTAVAPTKAEMQEMLSHAGTAHNIDADLLASLVRAESGGQVHAVSRTGARGLMQLMPATATSLGVKDAFQPEQNIAGGTAYLDGLLIRYHDNIALALAAYNAGPGAVDRYHGVPPYAETRAYVARVIREFNRRKQTALVAATR
ncbi:MAG: Lytic transglycosylase catalytic [Acidobacteriaceae bacterium]|nr:Lytic transglycosylase catalytic [Acidobacteriaceae bacterium]